MNLSQALQDSGAINAMARQFGVDDATAQKAANAMLPAIVAGLGRDHVGRGGARDGGGLQDILGGALGGGGGLLDQVLSPQATSPAPGNDILGQIFGSKDVSRGVAEEAAGTTGLPAQLLKQMLPVLVMAVVGYMMRGGAGGGGTSRGQGSGGGAMGNIGRSVIGGILGRVVAQAVRKAI